MLHVLYQKWCSTPTFHCACKWRGGGETPITPYRVFKLGKKSAIYREVWQQCPNQKSSHKYFLTSLFLRNFGNFFFPFLGHCTKHHWLLLVNQHWCHLIFSKIFHEMIKLSLYNIQRVLCCIQQVVRGSEEYITYDNNHKFITETFFPQHNVCGFDYILVLERYLSFGF